MIFGLIGLLTISVLAGAIIWIRYRRLKSFVAKLAEDLRFQVEHRQPLEISTVPERAVPLYLVIKSLLRQLPSNIGIDPLTGLPNRQWFKRAITPLMPVTRGTLVMLDIDRFRLVNDLFGFSAGDKILQGYAARLRQSMPQPRFVVRMDGDEFLLFYEQPLNTAALETLQQELQRPYQMDKTPIGLKVRVGYLQLDSHHADTSLMLKRVDLALKKRVTVVMALPLMRLEMTACICGKCRLFTVCLKLYKAISYIWFTNLKRVCTQANVPR
ncbi:GGDEF domain-containing protein [Shewanella dokdonensis]|uniref:GGDEF domain-containing protein n=1 Tax=Shewanella dokdonensis TaxID=712036 RepID=UPI001FD0829D|nr:GGDEF domain-containing protein [Shewanella dokdonensis]